MSSSCGNPQAEEDTLMLRRTKFDRSKDCVRCKERAGNVVVRHAVYCKTCFVPLIAVKFRRALDPHINPLPDGPRRKGLKAAGSLLLGLSGGLGSSVLLDLVNRTYFDFSPDAGGGDDVKSGAGVKSEPRGGRDHPRNASVWPAGRVCYVETCAAFPGARDRTEHVRRVVAAYDRLEFVPLRVEDAFSSAWWARVGGAPASKDLGVDITNQDLILSAASTPHDASESESDTPASRLQRYIRALPTQTAIPSAVHTLTRVLLLYTAAATGASHLLLGTSLTSLSVSLIAGIAQGGGFAVREEAQGVWVPGVRVGAGGSGSANGNGHENGAVRVVRPLRDIGMKECAMWAWWHRLVVVGREKFPGAKQSIGPLTKEFIVGLERDYPSTVSTVARTCAKLAPKKGSATTTNNNNNNNNNICMLCERQPLSGLLTTSSSTPQRPAQDGVQDWKARISIRSFADAGSFATYRPPHFPERDLSITPSPAPTPAPSLTPFLCYACHTTLTSRSSRGTTVRAAPGPTGHPVPLPVWVGGNLAASPPDSGGDGGGADGRREEGEEGDVGETWVRRRMDPASMRVVVADFLLDD
ncbi:hypothetical protein H0H81_006254 [Sphagnurus paluster]|uniref:Cytoplasmic tRNA 2-thiolation protein 2 n=1 Tax=Sphagnurus paluster TaxID=117069 RepID=A0A9P7GS04_9AGAR|nr:hypothetical protein H0H81_006254 [Sphagnurus paluster]